MMSEPEQDPIRPDPPAGAPAMIGRYEVRAVLSEGAFVRVYFGFDAVLKRDVAIKVPHGVATAGFRERFLREARAAAAVYHRNVASILDVGEAADGTPYVVVPLLQGESLEDRLKRDPAMPPWLMLRIAAEVAAGLAAAHAEGLVHRDITPGNIWLEGAAGGQLRRISLLGLGWCFPRTSDSNLTSSGVVTGAPAYMSPEQATGREEVVGPLTDVYSLGVILYEMLTRRVPYQGSSVYEVLARVWEGKPIPPRDLRPDLDPRLSDLCLKAMAKDPKDRFPSARAFAKALEQHRRDTTDALREYFQAEALYVDQSPLPSAPPPARSESVERAAAPPGPPPPPPRAVPMPPDPDPPDRPPAGPPHPITDQVHFSVTAPAALRAGSRHALTVWAHLAAHRDEVLARARQAHPLGPVQMHTKGGVRVARGTALTVRLQVPTFHLDAPDEPDVIEWDGDIGSATFPVRVPADAPPGGHLGTVTVYAAGLQIARLHFDLQVADAAAPVGLLKAQQVRHRRAFASYASQDRNAVLARIQGLQKALPNLNVFLDVATLRSGQRWADELAEEIKSRDVFYLFWSHHASRSEWVEREWRAALAARGVGYIDPVPLADPRDVPPPPELAADLHFNDWVLAYMRSPPEPPRRLRALVVAAVLAAALAAALAWAGIR